MLIFLDTEFTGLDQTDSDLISIALVDQEGREFYAELPQDNYAVQANEWVHFNVLPHLFGGDYIQSVECIRQNLTAWIAGNQNRVTICTDCPDADFKFLVRLLPEWPKNLEKCPTLFTCWSLGEDQQPALEEIMAKYYTPGRPKHNALYDAHSLRLGVLYALEHGWQP